MRFDRIMSGNALRKPISLSMAIEGTSRDY